MRLADHGQGAPANRFEDFAEWEHGDLARTLAEIAASGVSFDDPRVGYVEVQIDRKTWEALQHG